MGLLKRLFKPRKKRQPTKTFGTGISLRLPGRRPVVSQNELNYARRKIPQLKADRTKARKDYFAAKTELDQHHQLLKISRLEVQLKRQEKTIKRAEEWAKRKSA